MPNTNTGNTACTRQYVDLELFIIECKGLPRMDFIGHADPYVILQVIAPDGRHTITYKTAVAYNTGEPKWNEQISLIGVPLGTQFKFQIMDKDSLKQDDVMGSCQLALDDDAIAAWLPCGAAPALLDSEDVTLEFEDQNEAKTHLRLQGRPTMPTSTMPATTASNANVFRLTINAAPGVRCDNGVLLLGLKCRASSAPGSALLHCGPVRYQVSLSRLAGAITGQGLDDQGWKAFAAYQLVLAGVSHFFPCGASLHWNTSYSRARQVYCNPAAVNAVRIMHSMLYADSGGQWSRGVLQGGGDLVKLLQGGVRDNQRRYYTYCITEDGQMNFSETGAAFLADLLSKHAMHSSCAEWVVYAGEFCLVPPHMEPWRLQRANGMRLSAANDDGPEPRTATFEQVVVDARAAILALGDVGGRAAVGWKLVIDNNSGTYAPPKEQLPALKAVMEHNFPGLEVLALDMKDEMLKTFQRGIPSRVNQGGALPSEELGPLHRSVGLGGQGGKRM